MLYVIKISAFASGDERPGWMTVSDYTVGVSEILPFAGLQFTVWWLFVWQGQTTGAQSKRK